MPAAAAFSYLRVTLPYIVLNKWHLTDMAGELNKNGGWRCVTFVQFSLCTGTGRKTISWYIDVLHQHGCFAISSGLQKSVFGQEERGIAEKSVTKEEKDQREDGLCTIQG